MSALACWIILAVYFTPWVVAWARQHPNRYAILCLNLFLGWTLVGWVVALSMALSGLPINRRGNA